MKLFEDEIFDSKLSETIVEAKKEINDCVKEINNIVETYANSGECDKEMDENGKAYSKTLKGRISGVCEKLLGI